MKTMKDDIQSVLYTEEQLREGVKRIAAEINRDYAGKENVIIYDYVKKFMLLVF